MDNETLTPISMQQNQRLGGSEITYLCISDASNASAVYTNFTLCTQKATGKHVIVGVRVS